jgi:hypothetical protein
MNDAHTQRVLDAIVARHCKRLSKSLSKLARYWKEDLPVGLRPGETYHLSTTDAALALSHEDRVAILRSLSGRYVAHDMNGRTVQFGEPLTADDIVNEDDDDTASEDEDDEKHLDSDTDERHLDSRNVRFAPAAQPDAPHDPVVTDGANADNDPHGASGFETDGDFYAGDGNEEKYTDFYGRALSTSNGPTGAPEDVDELGTLHDTDGQVRVRLTTDAGSAVDLAGVESIIIPGLNELTVSDGDPTVGDGH